MSPMLMILRIIKAIVQGFFLAFIFSSFGYLIGGILYAWPFMIFVSLVAGDEAVKFLLEIPVWLYGYFVLYGVFWILITLQKLHIIPAWPLPWRKKNPA